MVMTDGHADGHISRGEKKASAPKALNPHPNPLNPCNLTPGQLGMKKCILIVVPVEPRHGSFHVFSIPSSVPLELLNPSRLPSRGECPAGRRDPP